ncbi:MAG: hypothetical protein JWO94_3459 [Verrucomicrobiaceae bacterium]|nr:hypothetical protein [Verrucomicrobiaceae bacterium]
MNHEDVATLALGELHKRLAGFGLAACWETYVTATLSQALLDRGFKLQMGEGGSAKAPKARYVQKVAGKLVFSERVDRLFWLHQEEPKGSTEVCVVEPSIAHFEIKTGSRIGPKAGIFSDKLEGDLDRCFTVQEYDCIFFVLFADRSYYAKLARFSPSGQPATLRKDLATFLPPISSFRRECDY